MKRLGSRSAFVSTDEKADAGTNARKPLNPNCLILCVELNPPMRIAILKIPDSFYNSKLFTLKFLIMRIQIAIGTGFTIVEQAILLVPEFSHVVRKLEQQVILRGQSKSTLQNYTSTALSAPHPAYRPFRASLRETA